MASKFTKITHPDFGAHSQVVLRDRAEKTILVVGCLHIISGSARHLGEIHAIPGKPEAQQRFKRQIVINVLEQLKDTAQGLSRPAASQGGGACAVGFILVGDFNMLPKSMEQAAADRLSVFKGLQQACLAARHVGRPGPEQRDWAVTNWQVAQPDISVVVSNDKAHAAVVVDMTRPALPPPAKLNRKIDQLRERYVLRIEKKAKMQEEEDRSDEDVLVAEHAKKREAKREAKRLRKAQQEAEEQAMQDVVSGAAVEDKREVDTNTLRVLSSILSVRYWQP